MRNISLKLNVVSLFVVLASASLTFAQSEEPKTNDLSAEYNLPPTYHIPKKLDIVSLDYSEKINLIETKSTSDETDMSKQAKFIKEEITDEDWERLKIHNPEEYKYYRDALTYYNQLSPRVKSTLTTEELWNIYMFQQANKEKLLKY